MIIGMPGAGLSTAFYLFLAALMPFYTLYSIARGKEQRPGAGRLLLRQSAIAVGIILMFVVVAIVISSLVIALSTPVASDASDAASASTTTALIADVARTLSRFGAVIAIGTLFVVLTIIQLLSIWVRWRDRDLRVTPAAKANRGEHAALAGESRGQLGATPTAPASPALVVVPTSDRAPIADRPNEAGNHERQRDVA